MAVLRLRHNKNVSQRSERVMYSPQGNFVQMKSHPTSNKIKITLTIIMFINNFRTDISGLKSNS